MGLFSIGGGLLGAGAGLFSGGNSWQGWDNVGNFLMEGLGGALTGGLIGYGIGTGIDTLLDANDKKSDMPAPPPPITASPKELPTAKGQTLLTYEDPVKAPEVQEAAKASRKKVAAMRGRGATLLTGPSGLMSDEDKPGLLRKTLGGA
jgi:hypothetical protein